MSDRERDRQVDANLRRIARHVALPEVPAQRGDWTRPPRGLGPPGALRNQERWIVRHPRVLTAAGSAVAAAIAIAAFLFVTPGGTVHAATILRSFRATLADGFTLSYENLGDEGVRVSGTMLVLCPGPAVDPQAPLAGDLSAFYMDARVVADETVPEMPGLDLTTALAFSEQGQWFYLKVHHVPEALLAEAPMIEPLLIYAEQGLLLRLDAVFDALSADLPGLDDLFGGLGAGAGDSKVTITFDEQGALDGAVALHNETALLFGESQVQPAEDDAAERAAQLAEALIHGDATAADLEALVTLVEQAAQHVEVVEVEPGLYVLTAGEFAVPEGEPDGAWVAALEVQIAYREQLGIQWARVDHVGAYDGTLRIDPAGDQDRGLLAMEHFIEPGVTTVVDLSAFVPMIEAALRGDE